MDDSVREFVKAKNLSNWTSTILLTWRTILALAALLDVMATILPGLLRAQAGQEDDILFDSVLWEEYEIFDHPIPDFPFGQMLKFLNRNCGRMGFCFSIFWFVEAFLGAIRSRDRALLERDRKKLLQLKEDAEDDNSIHLVDDLGYLDDNWDSWIAFYAKLLCQLMLLPAGFYHLLSRGIYLISLVDGDDNGMVEQMLRETYDVEESFRATRDNNLALGILLLDKLFVTIRDYLGEKGVTVKHMAMKKAFYIVRKILGGAILHPRKFAQRMKNTLAALRWIKYIQPIFGASNKLKGNLVDLTKKYRQRREALIQQRSVQQMVKEMTEDERRDYAARKIQSVFRSHQVRRRLRALRIMQGEKETLAAIKMQAVFRRKLGEARVRIKKKQLELQKLQAKSKMDLWKKKEFELTRMSPKERLRLYELEEELHKESVRVLHRRMLMKPNTAFAVTWKVIFCVCVIFEITGLVVNPFLKKQTDVITGEPLSVDTAFKNMLVPLPVSELEECNCEQEVELDWWKASLLGWRPKKKKIPEKVCEPFPWYCDPPFSTARSIYIQNMCFVIDEFLLIVGLVVFLDVLISFFTGEFDETGALVPRPFFQRWILPGLVLQLLVNPKMAHTSELLGTLFHHACEVGPVRVWRWSIALFWPAFLVVFTLVERIWMLVVHQENHKTVFDQAHSAIMTKHAHIDEARLS